MNADGVLRYVNYRGLRQLPRSILVGVLYDFPYKNKFADPIGTASKWSKIINLYEVYLLGDFWFKP